MPRIRFIEARFFDPAETLPSFETRLYSHLSRLRRNRIERDVVVDQNAEPNGDAELSAKDPEPNQTLTDCAMPSSTVVRSSFFDFILARPDQ